MSRPRFFSRPRPGTTFRPHLEALDDRLAPGALPGAPEPPDVALLAWFQAAQQQEATRTTSPVVEFAHHDVVRGESTLLRTDNGVGIRLTASGLPQGVYTAWWVVINPGATGPIVGRATARVVGPDGTINVAAHLNEGEFISGHPVFPGGSLQDARRAEIRMVIRYHGPVDPGHVYEQMHTFQPELGPQNDMLITIHPAPAA